MIEIKRKPQQPVKKPTEGAETAQDAPEAQGVTIASEPAKKALQPFTAFDGSNYRAAYRAVCDFHERHNPPRLDDDGGETYWSETVDDMSAIAVQFNNDPFITGMLIAVYDELERQFNLVGGRHE